MRVAPNRLILVTPAQLEPGSFRAPLERALSSADVAAVILDLINDERGEWQRAGAALGPVVQETGSAFLLRDHVDLVRSLPCDGAHVTGGPAELEGAKRVLKPDFILGGGNCTTRHAAMTLGERTPDYVFLGRLDGEEDVPPSTTLIEWWMELFELPCVALAAGNWDSLAGAAAAGADFIALRDLIWNDPAGPAAAMRHAQTLVEERSEALA